MGFSSQRQRPTTSPGGWREVLCFIRAAILAIGKGHLATNTVEEDRRRWRGPGNCTRLTCFQLGMRRYFESPQMQRSPVDWW